MDNKILERAQEWLSDEYDAATRKEIQDLIDDNNETELIDRFWTNLEFGTGGLRGIRGAGQNRMNIYNIKKVTQGFANYLKKTGTGHKGVAIGRDSRIFSLEFAQAAAAVLIANKIPVYFFKDLCPTPVLSYSIPKFGAQAGIMNTASHNPKEYNGYKVFWDNGGQLTPPHDTNVIDEVEKISSIKEVKDMEFGEAENSSLFQYCDEIIDQYIKDSKSLSKHEEICQNTDLKILYSPLHGCGYQITPKLFDAFGFKNHFLLEAQATPDGNFPSASYPNPEDPQAMSAGRDEAQRINADIFIATDPDADRVGVCYKTSTGEYEFLNGNQIGILLSYYLLNHDIPKNSFVVSTIVSTPLIRKMVEESGYEYKEVLTGFKWVSHAQAELVSKGKFFLLGFEESHGYNINNQIHDKDGVSISVFFAELTAFYKAQGKFLDQVLFEIAKTYGYYKESQISVTLPGAEGVTKIKEMMDGFRKNPPNHIGSFEVLRTTDYLAEGTGLPKSNVFAMWLSDNIRVIARPSGTEPKIKFYFSNFGSIGCEGCIKPLDALHDQIKQEFLSYIK
ncbi:MAG: phospho-sugar mutase [Brevinema sp.]